MIEKITKIKKIDLRKIVLRFLIPNNKIPITDTKKKIKNARFEWGSPIHICPKRLASSKLLKLSNLSIRFVCNDKFELPEGVEINLLPKNVKKTLGLVTKAVRNSIEPVIKGIPDKKIFFKSHFIFGLNRIKEKIKTMGIHQKLTFIEIPNPIRKNPKII